MKFSPRHLLAGLGCMAVLLLAACGGGGGGSSTPRPVAVASADATSVPIGTRVTLDGSASTTPNEGVLTFEWRLQRQPQDSLAELVDATGATPYLVPDLPGDYVIDLLVSDGRASGTARLTVTATNPDPVAIIRPATQSVLVGSHVTLDGSRSVPPTGAPANELTYQWSLVEQPEGESVSEIIGATSSQASLLTDKIGIYRVMLVVRHGDRVSAPAEALVTVNAANSHPVIVINEPEGASYDNRGRLQIPARLRAPVLIDGSGSHDPDGDALHYRWRFATDAALPAGSNPVLQGSETDSATFTPDVVGNYHLDFTVYDNHVAVTQRVIVQVSKDPEDTVNTAPEVLSFAFGTGTRECELGGTSIHYPYCTLYATLLNAEGNTLTYAWTYWNEATPNERQTSQSASLLLDGSQAGTWQVRLVVSDGEQDSAEAAAAVTIKIGANVAPAAKVELDIARVLVGETLVFDGSGSSDRNMDRLDYIWTLIDKPAGSNAVIQQSAGIHDPGAYVVTDQPGAYTAFLSVRDSKGAVSTRVGAATSVTGFAKLTNNPPVLTGFTLQYRYFTRTNADGTVSLMFEGAGDLSDKTVPGQPLVIGLSPILMSLNFHNMFDPDQDTPLYYAFTVAKQPENGTFPDYACSTALGERCHPNSTRPVEMVPGDYEIEAVISDGLAFSETRRVTFTAIDDRENYPGLLLERLPSGDGVTFDLQVFFPFVATQYTRNGGVLPVQPGQEEVLLEVDQFRLTAFDQDYTIADLEVASAEPGYLPVFEGLANGQVIRRGESVVFRLLRPAVADEAALYAGYRAIVEGDDPDRVRAANIEYQRLKDIIDAYQFTWSFRVAEKQGYSFRRGTLN